MTTAQSLPPWITNQTLYQDKSIANHSSRDGQRWVDSSESVGSSSTGTTSSSTASSSNFSSSSSTGNYSGAGGQAKQWPPIPETKKDVKKMMRRARASGQALELCLEWIKVCKEQQQQDDSATEEEEEEDPVRVSMAKQVRRTLKRLAQRGYPGNQEAQYELANIYGSGDIGFSQNAQEACAWYIQASKQNHPEATFRAGMCFELGIGVKKDYDCAVMYYRKAAKLCHAKSMYRLAIILLQGYLRQTPQPREAVSWLQRAATNTDESMPPAMHALAMIQLNGQCQHTSLVADIDFAVALLHQAADLGYEASQTTLGELYEQGAHVKPDDGKSIYYYTLAAEQGAPAAALGLAGWYLTGSTTPGVLTQSDLEAYLWAKKAATAPIVARDYYLGQDTVCWAVAKGCFLVAYFAEKGIGMNNQDLEMAKEYYSKAVALGHKSAADRLCKLESLETRNERDDDLETNNAKSSSPGCIVM